jgi:hypothetical protein
MTRGGLRPLDGRRAWLPGALDVAARHERPAARRVDRPPLADIDWTGKRIRVTRNHVLGQFDTPKSRRPARSVPLSSHLVRELRAWQNVTSWRDYDAVVFAEPASGDVLRRGALMRRLSGSTTLCLSRLRLPTATAVRWEMGDGSMAVRLFRVLEV